MGNQKAEIAWTKIKNEYLSSDISYRDLAKKHGVSLRMIAYKAKEEDWQTAKQKHCNAVATRLQQKTIEKQSKDFADFIPVLKEGIIDTTTMLLAKIAETMSYGDAFSPRDLKSLSGMINDLSFLLKDLNEQTGAAAESDKVTVEFVKPYWETE
jgi:hypothetical protein